MIVTHSQRQPLEVNRVPIALLWYWCQCCRKAAQCSLHSPLERAPEKNRAEQCQQSNALNHIITLCDTDDYIRCTLRSREVSKHHPSMKLENCSKGLHVGSCFSTARIRTGHSSPETISRKTKLNKWQHLRWRLGICPSDWTAFGFIEGKNRSQDAFKLLL